MSTKIYRPYVCRNLFSKVWSNLTRVCNRALELTIHHIFDYRLYNGYSSVSICWNKSSLFLTEFPVCAHQRSDGVFPNAGPAYIQEGHWADRKVRLVDDLAEVLPGHTIHDVTVTTIWICGASLHMWTTYKSSTIKMCQECI